MSNALDDDFRFTWDELIVDNVTQEECEEWLSEWSWLELGPIWPVFLSRFGDWFFQRPEGAVYKLDVIDGTVEQIAPDLDQFRATVNTLEFQQDELYLDLLVDYRLKGIMAKDRQVIAFAPHPVFVDSLEKCKPMVMSMMVWQSLCSQSLRQFGDGEPTKGPGGE